SSPSVWQSPQRPPGAVVHSCDRPVGPHRRSGGAWLPAVLDILGCARVDRVDSGKYCCTTARSVSLEAPQSLSVPPVPCPTSRLGASASSTSAYCPRPSAW